MQPQELAPPPALRNAIKCFWHTCLDFGNQPAQFEVLPDGYAELIFHFGGPGHLATHAGGPPLPSPFLLGLLGQPVCFHTTGRLDIIGVRCFPWTVFDLLGLPVAGPAGVRVVDHPIARLHAGLQQQVRAGRVAGALAQVAQYFLAAQPQPAADPLLAKAGDALRAAHGTLPVHQVAAAAHATVRTLERRFKRAAGRTVKDVAGLMRFEQVRNHLWRQPDTPLAGLAQELGYADQAHLSREFRRYSGTTPAAFARQAKKARQAAGPGFVAFVQA